MIFFRIKKLVRKIVIKENIEKFLNEIREAEIGNIQQENNNIFISENKLEIILQKYLDTLGLIMKQLKYT